MGVKSIILAHSESDHMKSQKAKVLHQILGKPLISYLVKTAMDVGISEICLITGELGMDIKQELGHNLTYISQKEGNYITRMTEFIQGAEDIIILNGDAPLIMHKTLEKLLKTHQQGNNDVTILSGLLEDPHKIYILKSKVFKSVLLEFKNHNKEFSIEDIIEKILTDANKVDAMAATNATELLRINTRKQLAQCTKIMKDRINESHMDNGVTIEDPSNTYIEPDVKIGYDTIVEPNCMLKGQTIIGNDCVIGHNTIIENTQVANGVNIENSVIKESTIDDCSYIGPFAYIRPQSKIGKHVRIGDFVEIKNSSIGDYTKVSHLTYVGDADVGKHVNFGCGSVLVNYDSVEKHRSIIEDYAFIGCNTNLVSPVKIGERAYTAAGSTITVDVPKESLGISRVRQANKEGWVAYKYPKE